MGIGSWGDYGLTVSNDPIRNGSNNIHRKKDGPLHVRVLRRPDSRTVHRTQAENCTQTMLTPLVSHYMYMYMCIIYVCARYWWRVDYYEQWYQVIVLKYFVLSWNLTVKLKRRTSSVCSPFTADIFSKPQRWTPVHKIDVICSCTTEEAKLPPHDKTCCTPVTIPPPAVIWYCTEQFACTLLYLQSTTWMELLLTIKDIFTSYRCIITVYYYRDHQSYFCLISSLFMWTKPFKVINIQTCCAQPWLLASSATTSPSGFSSEPAVATEQRNNLPVWAQGIQHTHATKHRVPPYNTGEMKTKCALPAVKGERNGLWWAFMRSRLPPEE